MRTGQQIPVEGGALKETKEQLFERMDAAIKKLEAAGYRFEYADSGGSWQVLCMIYDKDGKIAVDNNGDLVRKHMQPGEAKIAEWVIQQSESLLSKEEAKTTTSVSAN